MIHSRSATSQQSELTASQTLLWASQQLAGASPVHNMAMVYTIKGEIAPGPFGRAWRTVVERNDALRTVFDDEQGEPLQCVLPEIDDGLELIDLSGRASPRSAAAVLIEQWVGEPLDLGERAFTAALISLDRGEHLWFLKQHHLITDALSFEILWHQLGECYSQARRGDIVPAGVSSRYSAFVAGERAARRRGLDPQARKHWEERRAEPLQLYGLPASAADTSTQRIRRSLGARRSSAIARLASSAEAQSLTSNLSRFNVIGALLVAYLYRVTGQSRITIGVPVHNRGKATWRETAGLFVEVLPLQVDVEQGESFSTLVEKVKSEAVHVLRFAGPGTCGEVSVTGVNVVLNYVTAVMNDFAGMPAQVEWLHSGHADRRHALRVHVHDLNASGGLTVDFDMKANLYSPSQRAASVQHWMRLCDALLRDPQQRIGSVALLHPSAVPHALAECTEPVARPAGKTVVDMFARQARATPDAEAICCPARRLTYRDLDEQSCRLARNLRDMGAGPGSRVGICLDRSSELVVAIWAVLKAGAAYVPVEPHYPDQRIAQLFHDADVSAVVAAAEDAPRFPAGLPCTTTDNLTSLTDGEAPLEAPRPDAPAYIMYTSGSTGQPKGVVISHGALASYCAWAASYYTRGEPLTFPLFTPVAFDLTVTSTFVPLVSGGRIVAFPRGRGPVDSSLLEVARDSTVDIVKLTPSHLQLFCEHGAQTNRIQQFILGGEDLTTELARRAQRVFGEHVQIHNEYGPTEATVGCIVHTFDPGADHAMSVPIGRPIRGMRALVLNGERQLQPEGVVGELYLSGGGLADGYWSQPERTSEQFNVDERYGAERWYRTGDFVRWNKAGQLEFLGRSDEQVKVGGVRIELGEIEAMLWQHSDVTGAFVTAVRPDRKGDRQARRCHRCGLASDYPDVTFDAQGICSICRRFEGYRDRASAYFKSMRELEELVAVIKRQSSGKYDCMMLLSGGKDSTYALCRLVDLGLRVFAFTLDNGYISVEAKSNIRRVCAELGVDQHFGSTPAMNEIFVDSLKRHANVCHGCFKTIYTLSTQTAVRMGIGYIFTGLSRGQFFETRLTEDALSCAELDVDQIDAMVLSARKSYHRADDAVSRLMDVSLFQDDGLFDIVRYVDFYRYCAVDLTEMLDYLRRRVPWIRPSDTGRSTNCLINNVGIHVHKTKKGFHNYALPYSWDVRLGHKKREDAIEELDDDIDDDEVQRILSEIGYGELPEDQVTAQRIVAYYVAPEKVSPDEVQRFLADRLPNHLLPACAVRMDRLPLTDNGKINRAALPTPPLGPDHRRTPYVPPTTETEHVLARLWCEVLRVDRVGVHDNFFDLGGDSLTAIQIVARAKRAGLDILPGDLFDHQTISALSRKVRPSTLPGKLSEPERAVSGGESSKKAFSLLDERQRDQLSAALRRATGASKP